MEITDVRVRKVEGDGKVKAMASIVIDGVFLVRDIRIVEGPKGLFVAMPSRKLPDGEFRDVAHPITQEARELIHQRILAEYEKISALEGSS
ncbi:MAG: septation regulator SpoVG [Bacillota bacterium]|nr:septation regulator SpoVG [Bacillota bacterium]